MPKSVVFAIGARDFPNVFDARFSENLLLGHAPRQVYLAHSTMPCPKEHSPIGVVSSTGIDSAAPLGPERESHACSCDACFAKYAGFTKVVTAENARNCTDATQYLGTIVNGVEENVLVGAYRFPDDDELVAPQSRFREIGLFGGADPVRQMA